MKADVVSFMFAFAARRTELKTASSVWLSPARVPVAPPPANYSVASQRVRIWPLNVTSAAFAISVDTKNATTIIAITVKKFFFMLVSSKF
jgi:hypothetical protein